MVGLGLCMVGFIVLNGHICSVVHGRFRPLYGRFLYSEWSLLIMYCMVGLGLRMVGFCELNCRFQPAFPSAGWAVLV